jgi:hypothetical protein
MQNPPQQAGAKPAPKKQRPRLAAVGDGPPSEGAVSGPVPKGAEPPPSERGEESSPEPPAQAEVAEAAASGEREPADVEDAERKDDDGAPARPQPGGRKPKRELPPYLRVIK